MRFVPRFRLSTVLILTAILAWGMATDFYVPDYRADMRGLIVKPVPVIYRGSMRHYQHGYRLNWELLFPALALVAFLTWKAAWALRAARSARWSRKYEVPDATR